MISLGFLPTCEFHPDRIDGLVSAHAWFRASSCKVGGRARVPRSQNGRPLTPLSPYRVCLRCKRAMPVFRKFLIIGLEFRHTNKSDKTAWQILPPPFRSLRWARVHCRHYTRRLRQSRRAERALPSHARVNFLTKWGLVWRASTVHRTLCHGTPCRIDSSSLGARRRLGKDATKTQHGCRGVCTTLRWVCCTSITPL